MAVITFPSSPSNNDIYTFGGKTWQFNGTGWHDIILPPSAIFYDVPATISVGYKVNPANLGIITTGTVTPDANNGNYQYLIANGAFTLAAPAADSAIDLYVLNGSAAGTISMSGFTANSTNIGDTYNTTNTNKFLFSIRRINSITTYTIKAYQ